VSAAPDKLAAKVLELKPAYMTLQLTVPERLKGKQLFAVAFIKTDQWYPQPSMRKSELMKRVRSSDQVTLTTAVPRSPFVGGGTRGRAVALFDSEKAFDAFLKDLPRAGYRAAAQHAIQIFLISEEKQVTPTDRLMFHHPSIGSPLLSRSSFRGPAVEVGPGSAALVAAQQPLSSTLLAEVHSPMPAGSMGNLPLATGASAQHPEALLVGLEETIAAAQRYINQPGFPDALDAGNGAVVLPPEEARRLFGAPIAIITPVTEATPSSGAEGLLFIDTDLWEENPLAFDLFATISTGHTGAGTLAVIPQAQGKDLIFAQTGDLTRAQITTTLSSTFPPGQAPRVVMAGLEDAQTLTTTSIITLWTDPTLPDVVVINVVFLIQNKAGETHALIVAT